LRHVAQQVSRLLVACSIAALFAAPCLASEPTEEASEFLRLSGLDRYLGAIEHQFVDSITSREEQIPLGNRSLLIRVVAEAHSAHRLKQTALSHLDEQFDSRLADEVLSWLRSPAILRITKLTAATSGPEWKPHKQAYGRALQQRAPTPSRLALVQRVDSASKATDTGIRVAEAASMAVLSALNAANGYPMTTEALEREIDSRGAQRHSTLYRETVVSFLYSYRDLPDPALEHYAEFLETEAGQWYSELTAGSVAAALGLAARKLEASLRRELAVSRSQWQ